MKEEFEKLGIIFTDTDSAPKRISRPFQTVFCKISTTNGQQIGCPQLSSLVWWEPSFMYQRCKSRRPHFKLTSRINNENTGQFERTLIIVDEGASVHYVEGCTAPTYSSNSLHAAIVEIFAFGWCFIWCYTTIQNWSDNVYNLVTNGPRLKRCHSWVDDGKPRVPRQSWSTHLFI